MKANEKRAEALSWGCESVYRATTEKQIATALDAAERRGEERVLRWLSHEVAVPAWALTRYRKARRARGGKRS